MKKYKIAFFMPNLESGGAERVITNIIRQIDRSDFDIVLILVSAKGDYLKLIPKEVKIINLNKNRILFSIFSLRNIIKSINPDILFSSLFDTNIVLYLSTIGLTSNKKLIMRSPNSPKLVLKNNSLSKIKKFLLEKAYKKADLIIAQTPEMKDEISYYHNININKIVTFLNPLDIDMIDNQISNIENPFDVEKINVVAVGRLHRQKGFDVLIKAFKIVVSKNSRFFLHIIGKDKGEENNLKELVDKLKLNEFVKFHGFQSNPYKFYYYSDLYVLSSRWEGLPNTVLENLYLEKPIVSTKCIPFMNKLIENNKNGILVEVEDIQGLANGILNYKKINEIKKYKGDNINTLLNKLIKKDIF